MTTIALLFGGKSGEHEVSLTSARCVLAALDPTRYRVLPIGITRDGRWLAPAESAGLLGPAVPAPLLLTDGSVADATALAAAAATGRVDVVFPLLHGPHGEDGTVQGLLELLDVPYVGCGVAASAIAMDKVLCKAILRSHGFDLAPERVVLRARFEVDPDAVVDEAESLGYPMFVKPANLGSSVGISKAHDRAELRAALELACAYDRKVLVEGFVDGREIEVAVLGNDDPEASLPGEVVPAKEFYDYEAKYQDVGSTTQVPAELTLEQTAMVRELALRAFQAVDGAGMARVDFFLRRDTGTFVLNEINTIPGFTPISMYPTMWQATGLSYGGLIDRLVTLARDRHRDTSRNRV